MAFPDLEAEDDVHLILLKREKYDTNVKAFMLNVMTKR